MRKTCVSDLFTLLNRFGGLVHGGNRLEYEMNLHVSYLD